MKLLIAAPDLDADGWSWTVPGELVVATAFCDLADDPNHDPGHDCLRSFVGLVSGRATTLARVAELDFDRAQLLEVIRDSWTAAGADLEDEEVDEEGEAMLTDAAPWPVGAYVRRYAEALERA